MIETIQANGNILAIIIPADHKGEGSEFFSPEQFSLQLGYMKRQPGYKVEAHYHQHQQRQIRGYQEVLFIRSGRVKIDLYNETDELVKSRVLSKGDCILLAAGGHSVELLEEAEIIEVKQGPFMGDDDKVFIKAIQ